MAREALGVEFLKKKREFTGPILCHLPKRVTLKILTSYQVVPVDHVAHKEFVNEVPLEISSAEDEVAGGVTLDPRFSKPFSWAPLSACAGC